MRPSSAIQRKVGVAVLLQYQFLVEGAGVKTDYLLKGQTGTVVLKEPGVYHYGDTFYPATESLKGVIEVRKQ